MEFSVLDKIKEIVKNSKHIVFLGGAGVSTASGIDDFRSPKGLYNIKSKYGVPYEIMLSHRYFYNETETFYDFYWKTMVNLLAKPNKAHLALSNYEKSGRRISIITQNIDGLHSDAGSKEVYEVHGSTKRYICDGCGKHYSLDDLDRVGVPKCPVCHGIIKPDVVLYEEPLDEETINQALAAMVKADLLIVGGTSMTVYPCASFPTYFRGKTKIIINKEPTPFDSECDFVIRDDIGDVLEYILK